MTREIDIDALLDAEDRFGVLASSSDATLRDRTSSEVEEEDQEDES